MSRFKTARERRYVVIKVLVLIFSSRTDRVRRSKQKTVNNVAVKKKTCTCAVQSRASRERTDSRPFGCRAPLDTSHGIRNNIGEIKNKEHRSIINCGVQVLRDVYKRVLLREQSEITYGSDRDVWPRFDERSFIKYYRRKPEGDVWD